VYIHYCTHGRRHPGRYTLLYTRTEAPWWVLLTVTHTVGRHPGGVCTPVTHPEGGILVGMLQLLHTRKRHPGGYLTPVTHLEEAPWWVLTTRYTPGRGTLVGINPPKHPEEAPW